MAKPTPKKGPKGIRLKNWVAQGGSVAEWNKANKK